MTAQHPQARERVLDVSDLEPCEPLERALEAVRTLQPGEYLRLVHRQEPLLLYPMLEKLGMAWRARHAASVEILIHRRDDAIAGAAVAALAGTED